jgi:hypothetical protein
MTRHPTPSVRLSCDRLEDRDNPAGNVVAGIGTDGVLYIRGDSADNVISVQQNVFGDLYVFGRSGTTVNGQSAVYLGRGYAAAVSVVTDAGNDLVEMIGVRTNGIIYAQMGNENDSVAMYGVIAGNLNLQMEGGDDVVITDGVYVGNYAVIEGGSGFDTIDYRQNSIYAGFYLYIAMERQVGGGFGYP